MSKLLLQDYTTLLQEPQGLSALLAAAHAPDLAVLGDYITDNGQGRFAVDSEVTALLSRAKTDERFDAKARAAIEREVLLFGGNSVANVFRRLVSSSAPNGGAITYDELLRDVAKKLDVPMPSDTAALGLERRILLKLFQGAREKAEPEAFTKAIAHLPGLDSREPPLPESLDDRPEYWAAIGAVVAGAMGQQLLHRSVVDEWVGVSAAGAAVAGAAAGAAAAAALRGAAIALVGEAYGAVAALAGPVGLVIGGIWTIASLASPAYRVTVPCVVQLGYMRNNYLALARLQT